MYYFQLIIISSICGDFTLSSFFIPLFCLPFIIPQLVWAECVRQRNEVAIKLGIISPPPLSLFSAICSEQTWSLIGWWLQRQASSLAAGS